MLTDYTSKLLSKNAWLCSKEGHTIARNVYVKQYDNFFMFNDALIPLNADLEITESFIQHKIKGWKMIFNIDKTE